jgi:hypothetical protein
VAFAPFHPKYAVGADRSIGMQRIPTIVVRKSCVISISYMDNPRL